MGDGTNLALFFFSFWSLLKVLFPENKVIQGGAKALKVQEPWRHLIVAALQLCSPLNAGIEYVENSVTAGVLLSLAVEAAVVS